MAFSLERLLGGSKVREISSDLALTPLDARLQVITATSAGLEVRMPPLQLFGGKQMFEPGSEWLIIVVGGNPVDVVDWAGTTISVGLTLSDGEGAELYVLEAEDTPGEWEFITRTISSASNPVVTTYGHLFASNSDPDSVWEHNQLSGETQSLGNAPISFQVLGGQDAAARRRATNIYVHSTPLTLEDFVAFDPNVWDEMLPSTGARGGDPFQALVHDDTEGDFIRGLGAASGGGGGIESWRYAVGGVWLQRENLATSRTNPAWYETDTGSENAYVFPVAAFPTNQPYKFNFANEADSNIAKCPRIAQTQISGFHVPTADRFYDVMGRITASPRDNSSEVIEYQPTPNEWFPKAAFPFSALSLHQAWGIGSNGYICGGGNEASVPTNGIFRYVQGSDEWFSMTPHSGGAGTQGQGHHANGATNSGA